jgi:hypothetical protein
VSAVGPVRGLGRESYPCVFRMMFVFTSDRSFSTVLIRLPPLTRLLFRNSSRFPVWRVTGRAVHRGRTFRRGHDGRSDPTASQRSAPTRPR